MTFIEEPLSYAEALRAVRAYEREHKIASEDLFNALARSRETVRVHSDDLYEWRSYYEFVRSVDERLEQLLDLNTELGEDDLIYASADPNGASTPHVYKKKQDLCLAA